MSEIKIHIFHIGKVCVAPELPFGGEHCSALKASGVLDRKSKRLWLPVSAYLIECAHGNVLFDCGWHRDMSPHGVFERRAQIRSLGSLPLYFTNQVVVESSAAIDEQLAARGVAPVDWDAVLLSPSCCDPLCRRAVRVSMGTVFQVPWGQLGETPADWPEKGMDILHSLGFKTAAMALSDRSVSIDDEQLAKEPKLAIVLGTEGDGLAAGTIASCDYTVKIPMSHGVDSLNVAAASAVAFWQLGKQ